MGFSPSIKRFDVIFATTGTDGLKPILRNPDIAGLGFNSK